MGVVLAAILGFVGNVGFYILEYHVWNHVYKPTWMASTYLGYIIVGMVGSLVGLTLGSLLGKPSSAAELGVIAPKPLEGVEVFDVVHDSPGTAV